MVVFAATAEEEEEVHYLFGRHLKENTASGCGMSQPGCCGESVALPVCQPAPAPLLTPPAPPYPPPPHLSTAVWLALINQQKAEDRIAMNAPMHLPEIEARRTRVEKKINLFMCGA